MKRTLSLIAIGLIAISYVAYSAKPSKTSNEKEEHPARLERGKYQKKIGEISSKYSKFTLSEAPPGAGKEYWNSIIKQVKEYYSERKKIADEYRKELKPYQKEIINAYINDQADKTVRITVVLNKYLGIDELSSLIHEHKINLHAFNAMQLVKYPEESIEKIVEEYKDDYKDYYEVTPSQIGEGHRNGYYASGFDRFEIRSGFNNDGSLPDEFLNAVESDTIDGLKVEKVFKGVYGFDGFARIDKLQALIDDGDVFVVEIAADDYFGPFPRGKFWPLTVRPDYDGIISFDEVYFSAKSKKYK